MRAAPSILATAIVTLLGCSDSTGPSEVPAVRAPRPPAVASFQISPTSATLEGGETQQLTSTYTGDASTSSGTASVAWFSTDETVATVSPGGLVRGVGTGQARIIAVLGPYRASASITVVGGMKKHEAPTVCLQRIPRAERSLVPEC
jgi:hypothetical protein